MDTAQKLSSANPPGFRSFTLSSPSTQLRPVSCRLYTPVRLCLTNPSLGGLPDPWHSISESRRLIGENRLIETNVRFGGSRRCARYASLNGKRITARCDQTSDGHTGRPGPEGSVASGPSSDELRYRRELNTRQNVVAGQFRATRSPRPLPTIKGLNDPLHSGDEGSTRAGFCTGGTSEHHPDLLQAGNTRRPEIPGRSARQGGTSNVPHLAKLFAACCVAFFSPLSGSSSCHLALAARPHDAETSGPKRPLGPPGRRHHKRRLKDAPARLSSSSPGQSMKGGAATRGEGPFLLALSTVGGRMRSAGKAVTQDFRSSLAILRASVAPAPGGSFVITVRQDTMTSAARLLMWAVLVTFLGKQFLKLAERHNWGWARGGRSSRGRIVRDRSLGGREVYLSKGEGAPGNSRGSSSFTRSGRKAGLSPLDPVLVSRSEKNSSQHPAAAREQVSRSSASWRISKEQAELPGWWQAPEPPPPLAQEAKERGKGEAQFLLKQMLDKQMAGSDFSEDDIVELHRICRWSGQVAAFPSSSTRLALFRRAVDISLQACQRPPSAATALNSKTAAQFISQLAGSIGLEPREAARIVSGSVAARTRAAIIQAWALVKQNSLAEAENELKKLINVHQVFTPEPASPEMDMLVQGLRPRLAPVERRELLWMYVNAGGHLTTAVASSFLGVSLDS